MLRFARPALPCLVLAFVFTTSVAAQTTVYYLKGDPADQANKAVNDTATGTIGTATFDTTAPTGTTPVTQTWSPSTSADYVGNPLCVYCSGPFSGSVSCDL